MFPLLSAIKEQQRTVICFLLSSKKADDTKKRQVEPKCICSVSAQKSDLSTTVADQSKDLVAFFLENYCIWNNMLSVFSLYLLLPDHFSAFETMCSLAKSGFSLYLLLPDQSCDQCCDLVSRINHCLGIFFVVSKFYTNSYWWLIFIGAKKYKSIHWSFEIGRCWQGANLIAYSPLLGTQQLFPLAAKLETAVESNPNLI